MCVCVGAYRVGCAFVCTRALSIKLGCALRAYYAHVRSVNVRASQVCVVYCSTRTDAIRSLEYSAHPHTHTSGAVIIGAYLVLRCRPGRSHVDTFDGPTRDTLKRMLHFCASTGLRHVQHRKFPLHRSLGAGGKVAPLYRSPRGEFPLNRIACRAHKHASSATTAHKSQRSARHFAWHR